MPWPFTPHQIVFVNYLLVLMKSNGSFRAGLEIDEVSQFRDDSRPFSRGQQ